MVSIIKNNEESSMKQVRFIKRVVSMALVALFSFFSTVQAINPQIDNTSSQGIRQKEIDIENRGGTIIYDNGTTDTIITSTGHYFLGSDMRGRIIIRDTSDVTLDLNDHTIEQPNGQTDEAILVDVTSAGQFVNNIIIKNGNIFKQNAQGEGIFFSNANTPTMNNIVIENLNIVANGTGAFNAIEANCNIGGFVIRNCKISGWSLGNGITFQGAVQVDNVFIERCNIENCDNAISFITAHNNSMIKCCSLQNGTSGIVYSPPADTTMRGIHIQNCMMRNFSTTAIFIDAGAGAGTGTSRAINGIQIEDCTTNVCGRGINLASHSEATNIIENVKISRCHYARSTVVGVNISNNVRHCVLEQVAVEESGSRGFSLVAGANSQIDNIILRECVSLQARFEGFILQSNAGPTALVKDVLFKRCISSDSGYNSSSFGSPAFWVLASTVDNSSIQGVIFEDCIANRSAGFRVQSQSGGDVLGVVYRNCISVGSVEDGFEPVVLDAGSTMSEVDFYNCLAIRSADQGFGFNELIAGGLTRCSIAGCDAVGCATDGFRNTAGTDTDVSAQNNCAFQNGATGTDNFDGGAWDVVNAAAGSSVAVAGANYWNNVAMLPA